MGKGASQPWGGLHGRGRLVSFAVEGSDSMESPVVMGYVPVSAITNLRSGALWRAPPPLEVLRMAAWISWHAALCRLIRMASWSGHSPAICVQESGLCQRGQSSVGACPYLLANLLLYRCP